MRKRESVSLGIKDKDDPKLTANPTTAENKIL